MPLVITETARFSLFLQLFQPAMPRDERDLSERESNRERQESKHFKVDPKLFRLGPPDKFIQGRHRKEEQPPPDGQSVPNFIWK